MIRRLVLENWKAFELLDLEFHAGPTFVVAQNGVGKSSLVQALTFALYGEAGLGFPAEQARRVGSESTSVELTLRLPSDRSIVIRRLLAPSKHPSRGRVAVETTLDGQHTTESDLAALLSQEFGLDSVHLPNLTVLREGDALRDTESKMSFNVVDHLASLLGVDRADSAASELEAFGSRQKRAGDASRRDEPDAANATALADQRADIEASLQGAQVETQTVTDELTAAKASLDAARAWLSYRNTREGNAHLLSSLAQACQPILSHHLFDEAGIDILDFRRRARAGFDDFESFHSAINHAIDGLGAFDTRLAETRSATAALVARAERSREALSEAGAVCPVCRRPMSDADAEHAYIEIDKEITSLQRALSDRPERRETAQVLRGQLVDLERAAHPAVAVAPETPPPDATAAVLEETVRLLQSRWDEARLHVARLRELMSGIDQQVAERDRVVSANAQAIAAYRKEMIATMVATTLRSVSASLCAQQIDPLARELRKRWEDIWPGPAGLRLEEDGHLSLQHGNERVSFAHFSGGEKTFAVVMLRMLALQMLTKSSFLVLDEPLEHLDARNRRILAKLLVRAARPGPLGQLIVTTYEESLARALGAHRLDRGVAEVVYVKSGPAES